MSPPPEARSPRDVSPDGLEEHGAGDEPLSEEGLALLVGALSPAASSAASAAGAARLRDAVSQLPLRYAPFFRRIAALWEVSEQQVQRELLRAAQPSAWSFTLFPGVRSFAIDLGPNASDVRARLLRFAPGVEFPRHRHAGPERVLVLEGSYRDSAEREVGPGEEQLMPAESEHSLRVSAAGPCVAAVSERGLEFTGPWLRWISKLLR